MPADSPERASRTRKFQLVNDAYFTLSDPTRRREYDNQRKLFGGGGGYGSGKSGAGASTPAGGDPFADADSAQTGPNQSAYSWAWNFFTGQAAGQQQQQQQQQDGHTRQDAENEQFGDVFEEMLREEGLAEPNGSANSRFWGLLGGASGASLGFIVANVPGLLAGAVAGNRLGAIRDAKGKSVYAVFQVSGSVNVSFGGG